MAKNSLNDYTIQNANTIYGAPAGDIMDFKISLNAILSQHRTPAIVQSYNAETNEVIVKIALKHTLPERNDDGTYKRIDYANVKTTVRQPFEEMAFKAIEVLSGNTIVSSYNKTLGVRMRGNLIIRESV